MMKKSVQNIALRRWSVTPLRIGLLQILLVAGAWASEVGSAAKTDAGKLNLDLLRNPVYAPKDNVRDPSVIKAAGGYCLFYSRFSGNGAGWGNPENWHIAELFTRDFKTFANDRDISPSGCASPGDVIFWHGRWLLPYQTYPGRPTELVYSESTNLDLWSRPKAFLTGALDLTWNGLHRVIDPTFVVDGDTLHCFFFGSANRTNAAGKVFHANLMGHAVTRDPKLEQWEILSQEKPVIGCSQRAPDGVENAMVFRVHHRWIMIYSEGLESQHLARATSTDLVNWNLDGRADIAVQPWLSAKCGAPYVWDDGERWMMILMGTNDKGRTSFGLLSSSDGWTWTQLPAATVAN